MRRLLFALFALVIMASTTVTPSHAADRIVAVVNDQVITLSQLQARTRLNLRQVGLANATAQQQEAVSKRSLSNLIDEELQRQYAEKSGVTLTKAETETSIANVKQAMGDEVWKTFTAGGLEQAAKDKILAETRWQILIERNIRPRVQVSTAEADRLIAELAKGREIQEREISVIQMEPGTTPEDDKAKLDKLTELKQKRRRRRTLRRARPRPLRRQIRRQRRQTRLVHHRRTQPAARAIARQPPARPNQRAHPHPHRLVSGAAG